MAGTAARLGDFFQYAIDKPVSLPRQKSALLPIVGKAVEATRVSIYNEATQKKFPLLGLRLKNTSGAHLMQGPITIFEGSNYAGDAQILDLQPNEERLLSFAVDLGTEVDPKPASDNGKIVSLKAVKGFLWTTNKVRESKTYTVKMAAEANGKSWSQTWRFTTIDLARSRTEVAAFLLGRLNRAREQAGLGPVTLELTASATFFTGRAPWRAED